MTQASMEDLGPTDDDKLSDSQIKDIEDRKGAENDAAEQQGVLDTISKEMGNRDDGEGEIGDVRDALVEVKSTQDELASIRKQLEVANNNAVAAPDQKMGEEPPAPKEDEDLDDVDPAEEPADDDEPEPKGEDEPEDIEDDEDAAVESIRLQINNIYSRLGMSTGIEAYDHNYPKDMARSQLLGMVAAMEDRLEDVRPSLEWFNINALKTTVVSIFSVAKALEMNRKSVMNQVRRHGGEVPYTPVEIPAWGLDLLTIANGPAHSFRDEVDNFVQVVRHLITNVVMARAKDISAVVEMFRKQETITESDVTRIKELVAALGNRDEFLKAMSIGRSKTSDHPVINAGTFGVTVDERSGFFTVDHNRLKSPDWYRNSGLKGVYLTPTQQDDLPGLHTLVLSSGDILHCFDQLTTLLDDIRRFSDTMEKSHKGIKEIAAMTSNISRIRPELMDPLKQLEGASLGLYTSTDTIATAMKQVIFRFTSLSAYIKYS